MKKFIFEQKHLDIIVELKKEDESMTFTKACGVVGISPATGARALKCSDYFYQVCEVFPMMQRKIEEAKARDQMRKLKIKDMRSLNVDLKDLRVRAATMDWRTAA